MADQQELIFGYWNVRGRGQPIRFLLEYCEIAYIEKQYVQKSDWFDKDKKELGFDYPNLPYIIHGDFKLTESLAIYQYIAEISGKENILGKSVKDRCLIMQNLYVISDVRAILRDFSVGGVGQKEEVLQKSTVFFERFNKSLQNKKWLSGDQISIADFFLYEVILLFIGLYGEQYLKENFGNLDRLVKDFDEIPQIIKYHQSEKYLNLKQTFLHGVNFIGDQFIPEWNKRYQN